MTPAHGDVLEEAAMKANISPPEIGHKSIDISLLEVLTQLAYRKLLIAKFTGAATLTGLILCFILPVKYAADTKIMPPQQTPSTSTLLMNQLVGSSATGSLAAMAGGGLGFKNPNDVYVALLNSRPVADAIISKFDLAKVYKSRNMTQARRKLAANTAVTSEKSGLISVTVTDRDKSRAAAIANAYTAELRALTKTLAIGEAGQRRMFYEDQLRQSKESLVAAELAFQQIQQQKGLIQLDAQAKAMFEGLAALRAQVAAKQVELQSMRSYSTDQNPSVQLVERELASLQAEESRLEQNNHAGGIAGVGLKSIPVAGLEYLRAEHELKYQQALYDMLLKQSDVARLDQAKEAVVIQVVEPAIPPDYKSAPKRSVIVLLFTICGFLCSCGLALALWWSEFIDSEPQLSTQVQELRSALWLRRRRMGNSVG